MKVCNVCGNSKEIEGFYKNKNMPDGHLNACKDCHKVKAAERYIANKVAVKEKNKQWKLNNKERSNELNRLSYHSLSKERKLEIKAYKAVWAKNNKSKISAYKKRYNSSTKGIAENRLNANKRRSALVLWADNEKIRLLYQEAARLSVETGIEHHVDHIIPIRNRFVCGLHVHENMRVIPASENLRKKNKFIEGIV